MVSMVDGWICNRDFGIETASRAAPQLPTRAQKYMIPVQCSVVRSHPNNQHDSQETGMYFPKSQVLLSPVVEYSSADPGCKFL